METGSCDSGVASKCAGWFISVVTAAMDLSGRAYVKLFYAQQNAPAHPASAWLMHAAVWWMRYLAERPWSYVHVNWFEREHVRVFTDASGEDRCISAVIVVQGVWRYTWTVVPDEICTGKRG